MHHNYWASQVNGLTTPSWTPTHSAKVQLLYTLEHFNGQQSQLLIFSGLILGECIYAKSAVETDTNVHLTERRKSADVSQETLGSV